MQLQYVLVPLGSKLMKKKNATKRTNPTDPSLSSSSYEKMNSPLYLLFIKNYSFLFFIFLGGRGRRDDERMRRDEDEEDRMEEYYNLNYGIIIIF